MCILNRVGYVGVCIFVLLLKGCQAPLPRAHHHLCLMRRPGPLTTANNLRITSPALKERRCTNYSRWLTARWRRVFCSGSFLVHCFKLHRGVFLLFFIFIFIFFNNIHLFDKKNKNKNGVIGHFSGRPCDPPAFCVQSSFSRLDLS